MRLLAAGGEAGVGERFSLEAQGCGRGNGGFSVHVKGRVRPKLKETERPFFFFFLQLFQEPRSCEPFESVAT